ncbi:MAG: MBL fold metallo-hydrolase [Firmicutes bacterium]|nr:MBL fold metallo-hydrolase [Bacillota bacterium]
MKITVLMENTTPNPNFAAEHGLSLFVQTASHNILFDSGQTGAFAENAEALGIDLSQVDIAILSHGHFDHSGGLKRFFELNEKAPVYLSRHAFMPHLAGKKRNIGMDESLKGNSRLIFVDNSLKLDDELSLFSCNDRAPKYPVDSFGLNMLENGQLLPDDFRHEQYLMVEENGKKVLFSGCSHKGILNIMDWFSPDILVGGFHFMELDPDRPEDKERLENSADILLQYPAKYYTGHCTGATPYVFLKNKMGDALEYISTGKTFLL